MPLAVADRNTVLEQSWRMLTARDFLGIATLLSRMPEDVLMDEPELGFMLANSWGNIGEVTAGLELIQKVRAAWGWRGNNRTFRDILNTEGKLLFYVGRIAEAERVFTETLQAAEEDDDGQLKVFGYNNLGILAHFTGRDAEALTLYERAALASRQIGSRRGVAIAYINIGMAYRGRGLYAEADRFLDDALVITRALGEAEYLGLAEIERALVLHLSGYSTMARALVSRARNRLAQHGMRPLEGEALRAKGIIELAQRLHIEARSTLDAALEIAREVERPMLEAEVLEELAALHAEEGDTKAAGTAIAAAAALFRKLGAEVKARQALSRLNVDAC